MKFAKLTHPPLAAALGLLLLGSMAMNAADSDPADASGTNTADVSLRLHRNALVSIGRNVELKAGDTAQAVVVIGGSAKVMGDVDSAVVVIGGDTEIDGEVGDNVVTVMGNIHLGPKAKVHHDLVSVGGTSTVADGAYVGGQEQEVGIGHGPGRFLRLAWLANWVRYCALELRPLSFNVGWIWPALGVLLLIYFLIAVLFPHPVQCCVNQLSARPGGTLAAGILTKLAMPILFVILLFTVIGIVAIPFVIAAGIMALVVGKVAILEFLGGKLGGRLGLRSGHAPLWGFLIGAVLITLLYLIPVIGLITLVGVDMWGFGAAVTAIFVAVRRERPPAPPAPAPAPPPVTSEGFPSPISIPPAVALTPPCALAYPRAGFWERMAAGFLDLALVCLTSALVGPFFFFIGVAYFAGMWAWKGTTVGGIVLNLQVVRQDGHPLTPLPAFVRIVAALFSAFVLFLGFFWIGWDSEKQAWHDKIAGTVVVRLPKAISLVCL